jgi:hypothetical protein
MGADLAGELRRHPLSYYLHPNLKVDDKVQYWKVEALSSDRG